MKTHNDITNELEGLGSTLASLSRTMPYDVPDNYFEQLPGQVIAFIKVENEPDTLLDVPKVSPFAVPDGYFDALATNIMAALPDDSTGLNVSTSMPFHVPAGYFDELPLQVEALLAGQNIKQVAGAELPYSVAPGYFASLPAMVLQRIKIKKNKIIRFSPVWQQVRLGAAAVLLLCMGFGFLQYYMQEPYRNTEVALAKVPKSTISDYVQLNIDDFDQEMIYSSIGTNVPVQPEQLTKEEIIQYLNETGGQ